MSPLFVALAGCGVVAAVCWILSVVTREYSWVDRLWSIVPIGYVAWFAFAAAAVRGPDSRLVLMTILVGLWGARLTFNFARKGGYRPGGEDYRWAELRRRMSPLSYQLFNFGFIAGYQNLLLLLISLPAWMAMRQPARPLGALDVALAAIFVALLVGETIADEQQWRFQEDKRRRRERGEPIGQEFLTTGLFRYSRHPNFFCEQGMWWVVYLFSIAAGAPPLNAAIVGPVLLTLLFHGSTKFTEELTLRKYPAYAEYQNTTSRLIPMPPRG